MRVVQVTHQRDDGGGGKGYQYSRGGGGVWLHDDILSGMTHIPSKL